MPKLMWFVGVLLLLSKLWQQLHYGQRRGWI